MRAFQQDDLTADRKGMEAPGGWLCKVFICGAEWIMLFVHEVVKGDFPAATASYTSCCVYGSVANDNLTKGIVGVPDMLLILFVFGHGKSPF